MIRCFCIAICFFFLFPLNKSIAQQNNQYSGFLDEYPVFEQVPEEPGTLRYRAPDVDLGHYRRIIIDPVLIWYAPESAYKGINPRQLARLSERFHKLLTDTLNQYEIVHPQTTAGTLRLRVAITNIVPSDPGELTRNVPGRGVSLQKANIEAELLDANTHRRLGALIINSPRAYQTENVGRGKWDDIEAALTYWAKRLRLRLMTAWSTGIP